MSTTHLPTDAGAAPATVRQPLDGGWAVVSATTGAPVQFVDAAHPERQFLLDERQVWHSVEHEWGSGHLVTDHGTARWNAPHSLDIDGPRITGVHLLGTGIRLEVTRTFAATLHERYRFTNTTTEPVTITALGIQTPFADVYTSSRESLETAVNAHVFTGGAWAWALAQPMDGAGRLLGVVLRAGELSSYSIESRNQYTLSNIRGHIVLQPTDHARNAAAFGGQPTLTLAPGEAYELAWEIGFHEDTTGFLASTNPPAVFDRLAARVGESITVTDLTEPLTTPHPELTVTHTGLTATITSATPGVYAVQIGEARTDIAFHASVEDTVRTRVEYILNHQTTPERPGLLRYGIVPVDTKTGLTQSTNGWSDWTDGSERIGMPILLQQARARGWADHRVDELLTGWALMAEKHLLDESAAPRRGSQDWATPIRLYDSPWLAQFFIDRYNLHFDDHHLDLAARILERAFELGGDRFLAIGFSEACADVIATLTRAGLTTRAQNLTDRLVESARHFVEAGTAIPEHEVNYEQSIVAPLINLLIDAHRLTGDDSFLPEIAKRLPWLRAFGGPQPHVRLQDVAIRHWDGYWFGIERLWGDVFPHYWSALTSIVLYRLPAQLRTDEGDAAALRILRANMTNYFADGSATCAFVMPSSIDGRPAHLADPLANDQDWHLSIWLRLVADGAPLD